MFLILKNYVLEFLYFVWLFIYFGNDFDKLKIIFFIGRELKKKLVFN